MSVIEFESQEDMDDSFKEYMSLLEEREAVIVELCELEEDVKLVERQLEEIDEQLKEFGYEH
jgi:hypothetical protein